MTDNDIRSKRIEKHVETDRVIFQRNQQIYNIL